MTRPRCRAVTQEGAPCRAYAVSDSDYCFQHDPAREAQRLLARRKGGRARHGRTLGPVQPSPPITLESMADVAALLQGTINQTLRLENSLHRARTIGYLAGLLIKALDIATLEERIDQLERTLKSRENPP